jgi:hypothetical protein
VRQWLITSNPASLTKPVAAMMMMILSLSLNRRGSKQARSVQLSLHASSCSAERNWSAWGRSFVPLRNRLSHAVAEKMIFVKGNLARPVEDMAEV